MRAQRLLVIQAERAVVDAALVDGALPALVRRSFSLDRDRPLVLVEGGGDPLAFVEDARAVAVLLDAPLVACALHQASLIVARVDARGRSVVVRWPEEHARAPELASSPDDHDALAQAFAWDRALPEEVLERALPCFGVEGAALLGGIGWRASGRIPAVVHVGRERLRPSLTMRGPRRVTVELGAPFAFVVEGDGLSPPLTGALSYDVHALAVDVVRLGSATHEEVVPLDAAGGFRFAGAALGDGGGRGQLVVEGVARRAGVASVVVRVQGVPLTIDVDVRGAPRPLPLAGVSPARRAFLARREHGPRAVWLAVLTLDDAGARARAAILGARRRALPIVAVGGDAAAADALDDDAVTSALARGARVEARDRDARARTTSGLVVAPAPAGDEGVVVMAAVGASDDELPIPFAAVVDAAAGGGVMQAVRGGFAWDIFAAPFQTPYESCLGVDATTSQRARGVRARWRAVGTELVAGTPELAASLAGLPGARVTPSGAHVALSVDEIPHAERVLAPFLVVATPARR